MNDRQLRIFAGTDLAERIENAERTMIFEATEAAARRNPSAGAFATPLAGGVAAWASPGSPLNKVAGLGFGGPVDDAELDAIERAYTERRSPVQVELSTAADPALAALLTRRGYVLVGFENVLALALEPGREAVLAKGIEVRDSPEGEFDLWLDLVVSGFAAPDTQGVVSNEEFPREVIEGAMRDCMAANGFVRSIALSNGVPAGGGSLRLHAGVAQLCGAATIPSHRRRGVQSSLLEARLAQAAAAGSEVAVVTTQPGSRSQQNVQRQGFELVYARAVLVREA
ncbi:MAG: GNAT family N-acetyltransferase [Thermoanaerobaculia bacterium]